MNELDSVVLTRDVPEHGLAEGDLGTIVFCYPDGEAFEVEFLTAEDGDTVAVLTLQRSELRPLGKGDILHARRLGAP